MTRRVIILVGDPADTKSLTSLTEEIDTVLDNNPAAKVTWLQSADPGGHVLTCVVEIEGEEKKVAARKRK